MARAEELALVFKAKDEASKVIAAISEKAKEAAKHLAAVGKSLAASSREGAKGMDDLSASTDVAQATFLGFSGAMIAEKSLDFLLKTIDRLVDAFYELNIAAQEFHEGIVQIAGGEKGYKKINEGLNELGRSGRYATGVFKSISNSMLAAGVSVDDLVPTMQKLADIASGFGADEPKLLAMAAAFRRVQETGRAGADTIAAFTNAGTSFREFIGQKLGMDTKSDQFALNLNSKLQSMTITQKMFNEWFNEFAETQHGKAEEAGKTFEGSQNRIAQALRQIIVLATSPAFKVLSDFLSNIADAMTGKADFDLVKSLENLSDQVGKGADAIVDALVSMMDKATKAMEENPQIALAIAKAIGTLVWAGLRMGFSALLAWNVIGVTFMASLLNSLTSALTGGATNMSKLSQSVIRMFGTALVRALQTEFLIILTMLGIPILTKGFEDLFRKVSMFFKVPRAEMKDIGSKTAGAVAGGIDESPDALTTIQTAITNMLTGAAQVIITTGLVLIFGPVGAKIITSIASGVPITDAINSALGINIQTFLSDLGTHILDLIPQPIKDMGKTVWDFITGHTQISYLTSGFWQDIQTNLGLLWTAIVNFIPDNIKNFPGAVWTYISGSFNSTVSGSQIYKSVSDFFQNLWSTVFGGSDTSGTTHVGILPDLLTNFPARVWGWISGSFTSTVSGSSIYRSVSDFFQNLWSTIFGGTDTSGTAKAGILPELLTNFPGKVWAWISGGFTSTVAGSSIYSSIANFFQNLWATIFGGTDTSGTAKAGILPTVLTNFPSMVWGWVSGGFASTVSGSSIFDSISRFFQNLWATVFGGTDTSGTAKAGILPDMLTNFPARVWGWISAGFTSTISGSALYVSVANYLQNLTAQVFGGTDTSGNQKTGIFAEFMDFPRRVWNWLSGGFDFSDWKNSAIWLSIVGFAQKLKENIAKDADITNIMTVVDAAISITLGPIATSKTATAFKKWLTDLWTWISNTISSNNLVKDGGVYDFFITMGGNMIKALADGITEASKNVQSIATNISQAIVNALKKILGVSSPSTRMRNEVGIPISQGIAAGIIAGIPDITKAAQMAADLDIALPGIKSSGGSGGYGSAGGSSGSTATVNIVLEGQVIGSVVWDFLKNKQAYGATMGITSASFVP